LHSLIRTITFRNLLYSTTLFYIKSIVLFKVIIFPSSHNIRERPLGALFNIINIKKKYIAAFDINLSINFNLGLLLQFIPYYLLSAFILYQNFYILLLFIGAV
jgi:hypothetical protein